MSYRRSAVTKRRRSTRRVPARARYSSARRGRPYGVRVSNGYPLTLRGQVRDLQRTREKHVWDHYPEGSYIAGSNTVMIESMLCTNVNGTVAGIKRGDGPNMRQGNKIIVKSIELNLTMLGTGVQQECVWDIQIIVDRQPNGANPAASDLFGVYRALQPSAAGDGALFFVQGTLPMPNLSNSRRFKTLYHKRVIAHRNTDNPTIWLHKWISVNIPVEYAANDVITGGTGLVSEIQTNNILLVLSPIMVGGVASMPADFEYSNRLRFYD